MLVIDKKGTWVESCKESSRRETDVVVQAEEMAAMGKNDEHTRATIKRSLKQLSKVNEEEGAKELLESVQERKQQVEEALWKKMKSTLSRGSRTEGDQIPQTRTFGKWYRCTTNGEKLEHDFDELAAKVQEPGWRDGKTQTRCWVENEGQARKSGQPDSGARHHGLR